MAKFDLKKAIAKNKATFFGSLTEGQFSWMTQDTGQQIGSQDENIIPVYMFDDKGKYYYENDYEGYGVFGGKDYYDLVAEMNGYTVDDAEELGGMFKNLRGVGIKLAFGELEPKNGGPVLFPALVTKPDKFNYKSHDFTQEAETDPNQSWYEPEEDEEDNSFDSDDDEDYGYNDDEEELEEGYMGQFYAPEYLEKKYGKEMAKKIEAEIDEMDENSWDRFTGMESAEEVDEYVADIVNMLKEGEAAYEYEKGKEAGEKIEKKKMKKSELKAKIKEMIVAEMDGPAVEDSQYDFLKEIEGMLNEAEGLTPLQDYVYQYEIEISGEDQAQEYLDDIKKLNTPNDVYDYYAYGRDWQGSMDDDLENIYRQVKRKFKNLSEADEDTADAEAAADAGAEDTEVTDTEVTTDTTVSDVDPNVEAVQDALTKAQAAAQQLGDKKLMDQIGNTITFFTRSHVVEKPAGAIAEELNESMFPILKKILK